MGVGSIRAGTVVLTRYEWTVVVGLTVGALWINKINKKNQIKLANKCIEIWIEIAIYFIISHW